jgi:hypothetical protein
VLVGGAGRDQWGGGSVLRSFDWCSGLVNGAYTRFRAYRRLSECTIHWFTEISIDALPHDLRAFDYLDDDVRDMAC